MAHALNMFVPIKQDPETLKLLQEVKANFETKDQPEIEKAARESQILHFLRILVLDDKYFVVLTEYDGGHKEYAEFFRLHLSDLFKQVFTLADVPVTWDQLNDEMAFYKAASSLQVRSLGTSLYGETDPAGNPEGYLFQAFGPRTVKDMLSKLG